MRYFEHFNLIDNLDAVGLSAPDLRFLAFLITKSVQSVSSENRLSVMRNSVGHIIGTRFPANSSPVMALQFDGACPTTPNLAIFDLNDEASRVNFSKSRNIPDIRDVWRHGWSLQAEGPEEDKCYQFPVLLLVPRTWEILQLMAMVVTTRVPVDKHPDSDVTAVTLSIGGFTTSEWQFNEVFPFDRANLRMS